MAGFSFPPPPPPPPKATFQDASSAPNQTQPGAYGQRQGRGGGDRGRGRGRGRGSLSRGGFGRGGATNHHASMNHNPQFNRSLPPQQYASPPQNIANGPSYSMNALPAGGYINPAFASMYTTAVNSSPPASQPWLSHSSQTPGHASSVPAASNLPRPNSSHRLPEKPKPQAAPSVPSFGFALPAALPQTSAHSRDEGKSKKRKFNQLGLTPRSDVHEDSEEDDADEEAKFKAASGAIQIDYKGQSSTLKSAEEIAAWIEERKKRFPTKERIAQKQKEEDVRRCAREQAEAERKSRCPQQEKQPKKRKHKDADGQDKAIKKAEKLREKLRKAEKQIEKARAKIAPKTVSEAVPNKTLGINYDSDESTGQGSDDGSGSLAQSSSEVSTDSDSEESSSDGERDDDAPPEEESSGKRPLRVHLPNRKAIQAAIPRARREKETNTPKRKTLRERMVEQERRQEAELALRAIKFLGENGVLG